MNTKPTKTILILAYLSLFTYTNVIIRRAAHATSSCSKEDINHYLKSGFTHDQVVKLCTDSATTQPKSNLSQPISTPPQTAPKSITSRQNQSHPSSMGRTEDQVYFSTVIEGNPVTLSNDKLIFERKECAVYGDVNLTGFRDKACLKTRTTITLKGLQVLRATKGILLLKEQELLVKGHITRDYINTSGLNKYKMISVNEQLPTHPKQLNIPIKKGIDPKILAGKLKKYQ